jgi:RNA polymerase sigma-70 factor (ECF subfamily)
VRRRPDTELIALARAGSTQAVEVLFDRYWPYTWRTAFAVTADRALADDAAQEAIEKAFAALDRFDESRPFGPWLKRIPVNRAIDLLRSHASHRTETMAEIDALNVLDDTDDVPEAIARNQELELLTQAIQSLPERCRQVLTLRRLYGLSQKEVAARLGISENTVEHQVTIGVRKCTEFLARYWEK